mmetsp:Transcript_15062/g.17589  ORF Transcript_15062/g.17589 Transcript_15062/m.17589 type:complete len:87 (-) Transcript_15062:192-452(-)
MTSTGSKQYEQIPSSVPNLCPTRLPALKALPLLKTGNISNHLGDFLNSQKTSDEYFSSFSILLAPLYFFYSFSLYLVTLYVDKINL